MSIQFAAQSITITAGTLASGSARQSSVITSDTGNNVDDYRIIIKPTLSTGTIGSSKSVFVWIFTSEDGTNFQGNAGSTDAAITLDSPHQFALGCVIPFSAQSVARGGSFSLKAACGGSLPLQWGIIIENQTGIAFSSLAVSAEKSYYNFPASGINGVVNALDNGVIGNGTVDDSTNIQSLIDNNKGKVIYFPYGTYKAAGVLLSGSTYNNTTLIFDGEFSLATRANSATNNFGGAWVGLIFKDVDGCTLHFKGNGNRSLQPAEEHCHLVGLAAVTNMKIPRFEGREVRGDGMYIGQSNWQSSSANTVGVDIGTFDVYNSADDGRNALSLISGENISIGTFRSYQVGGVVNAVTMPGGFDIEPDSGYETIRNVSIGSMSIVSAGTNPLSIQGKLTSALSAPVQANIVTSTTGGTLAAATYFYVVTALNANGETVKSNEKSITTTGSTSKNTISWAAVTGATGYRIYRGTSTGAENVFYTVAANATSYIDTNATSSSGSPPGADSTTGPNCTHISIGSFSVRNTSAASVNDGNGMTTVTSYGCLLIANNVSDIKARGTCEYSNAYGDAVVICDCKNIDVEVDVKHVRTGARVGMDLSAATGPINGRLTITGSDIARWGVDVLLASNFHFFGEMSKPTPNYFGTLAPIHVSAATLTDVHFSINVQYDANWTRTIRQESASTLTNCSIRDCTMYGSWSSDLVQVGDVPIKRENVGGVTDHSAIPSGGTWVAGTFVRNNGPAVGTPSAGKSILGWHRLTTGTGNVSGTDWTPVVVTNS